MYLSAFLDFTLKEFLMGSEEWTFLLEIVLRTMIMFLTIIIGLRILGKRGVKQLSVFELVVIIGLGSAAGDPMFYKEVGIASSIIVFLVIICFYSILTYLIGRFKKLKLFWKENQFSLLKTEFFLLIILKKKIWGVMSSFQN